MWNTTLSMYDKYMLFVALAGKAFLVLQIATVVNNQSSTNVSFASYVVFLLSSLSWLVFGVLNRSTVVTASAFVGIIGSLVALNVVAFYR